MNWFSKPMTATLTDWVSGYDELGNPVYQTPMGDTYGTKVEPRRGDPILDALGWEYETPRPPRNALGLIADALWGGIEAPGNALRGEPVTNGDVWGTALDWGLLGAAGTAPKGSTRMFAGRNSRTADTNALATAERMAGQGVNRDEIWRDTGWFQGVDGKWRYEIDDSDAFLDPANFEHSRIGDTRFREAPAPTVMAHENLYDAYPDFRETELLRYPFENPDGAKGQYHPPMRGHSTSSPEMLTVWDGLGDDFSTYLHEAQHGIQRREGFAEGGSIKGPIGDPLPPNPKYDLWHQNQDAVKWANEYRESGRYAADQAATNRRWVEYWEPKLDAAKTDDEIDQIFAAAEAESRHRFPDMERVDDIAKSYGLNEPSPTIPPREWYRRLAGEVEARNVQTRRDMTPSQRRATPPWETQDVPDAEQIVRYLQGLK